VPIGAVGALRELPAGVGAVLSLCRIADHYVPMGIPHVEVRLIDSTDPEANPHLDFVLLDAVRAIEAFRAQDRTVLVHCVEALSRTPTVAALYGMRRGAEAALDDVLVALLRANPNPVFREALRRLSPVGQPR
jgi:ADP-ribosyl-[dinitrogen reductase] hydrolase